MLYNPRGREIEKSGVGESRKAAKLLQLTLNPAAKIPATTQIKTSDWIGYLTKMVLKMPRASSAEEEALLSLALLPPAEVPAAGFLGEVAEEVEDSLSWPDDGGCTSLVSSSPESDERMGSSFDVPFVAMRCFARKFLVFNCSSRVLPLLFTNE